MGHARGPESMPSTDVIFDDAYATLQAMPDQEDDGRMRVSGSDNNAHLQRGTKVITARTPDKAYCLDIMLQDADEVVADKKIVIDITANSANGANDIASVTFAPELDPLGNRVVVTEVAASPITVLTEADQAFLETVGLR